MAYEKEVLDLLNFMKEYKLDIDNLKLLITEASRGNFSRKLSELDLLDRVFLVVKVYERFKVL